MALRYRFFPSSVPATPSSCRLPSHLRNRTWRSVESFLLAALTHKHALDIHAHNVLFCNPAEETLDLDAIEPHTCDVRRKDGGPLDQGVPRQFVDVMEYSKEDCEDLFEIKLIDFDQGRSCNHFSTAQSALRL